MKGSKEIIILLLKCLALAVLNGYFFDYLNKTYCNLSSGENGMAGFSLPVKFMLIVVIVPFFETAIFQLIPNLALKAIKINNPIQLWLIPSVFFSLMHYYHWLYVAMTFVGGLILNYYYLEAQKLSKYSFLWTVLLHALYNLYGFLFVL